ncbi:DUF3618 domain-containing protein [Nocardioides sp. Soil805]|uniref:DUF3618 domain-containing protein n=1 Tax=Nocardioides sp. Soil805 TaxID=1736416 RepID=UPI00070379FA|nr:DUF3618 domain-containing protein [Nocardioides sp. Soil805]KRF36600.1 hypothetical protein ASG94_03980 [Nocardioides sp. Soil805]
MTNELSSLEREIEETRQRLAQTIDQLAYRTNPKTIVGREVTSIKAHFVDLETGEPRTDNILKVAGGVVGALVLLTVIRKIVR